MMNRLKSRMLAVLLCLVLALSCTAAALSTVDREAECSLTIRVDSEKIEELGDQSISAKVYRVAELGEDGLVPLPTFSGFDLSLLSGDPDAAALSQLIEQLAEAVKDMEPDATAAVLPSTALEGLSTGVYLVLGDQVELPDGRGFVFQPALISLPVNDQDEYIYDTEVVLKGELTELFGDLVIEKTLENYRPDLGSATFVFDVEAVKDGKNIYSNVLSLTFDQSGTKQTVVSHLPAGAEVTVTEIYSGASYELTSEGSVTVTILAEGTEGSPVTVSFTNTYDGTDNSGVSVVNHFEYQEDAGGWVHEKRADNASDS